ncbi:MAG: ATP-binding protein [Defluviitaleaceae bacterium]|nr:ATP-binding protein [Defluviitaleaceae bacterium]
MFKWPKTSIFVRMFIPIVCVMLIQAAVINIFLFASGTIADLNENAINILSGNAENRAAYLEHRMVSYWSNLGSLEQAVTEGLRVFLQERGITIDEFLGDNELEIALLYELSFNLLYALRATSATGVFMYFLDGLCPSYGGTRLLNGLYYRGLSPIAGLHENIEFLRGHVSISRRDSIRHGDLWGELFTFDPRHEGLWRGFAYPQLAARDNPGLPPVNVSFWNGPHLMNEDSIEDVNRQITYNRLIFLDYRPVAMIGTEMRLMTLEGFIPARDLANLRESGYVLLRNNDVVCETGPFVSRLLAGTPRIYLEQTQYAGLFSLEEEPNVRAVYKALRIYNPASVFAGERWALAAISTEHSLFEMSRTVNNVILGGSALAAALGTVFLLIAIKNVTQPIGLITRKLRESGGNAVITHKSNAVEMDLLAGTINDIIERRIASERQIREERQRYLLALESSEDIFIEYDIATDSLAVYYFTDKPQQTPEHREISGFMGLFRYKEMFHPGDRFNFFLSNKHEIRVNIASFPHIRNATPVDGYYWMLMKTIVITDNDGNQTKIIGTAREITASKLKELAAIETNRRDITSGLLNRDYGIGQIQINAEDAFRDNRSFGLVLLRIENFDLLEFAYGMVFGGIFIAEFCHALMRLFPETPNNFITRLGNDEFLMYYETAPPDENAIREAFGKLYLGEASDFTLALHIRTVVYGEEFRLLESGKTQRPVSVFLDTGTYDGLGRLALELLERSPHIGSSIRALMGLIGRLFGLERVVICSYDAGFATNQILHEWNTSGVAAANYEIKKITKESFERFKLMLEASDAMVYSSEKVPSDHHINTLLCLVPGASVSLYCCVLHEDAIHAGRVLFMASRREWPKHERDILHNLSKIIATYMNVEKSRSASQAKSRFLSRVSHEIRTPMNAILGMTGIAMEDIKTGNSLRVEDCLSKIDTAANYLLVLINDVLEMSRIESGKLVRIENKPFSLNNLIDETEALTRLAIESKKITFNIIRSFFNDRVIGDENLIKQVLINLLSNAAKFTNPGGTITFSAKESQNGRFKFSVKDTGIGIPFDKQATVFNAFEQVEALPCKNQGTGLGLSISQHIILAMNSTIKLESEPGKGSEFKFILHLPQGEAAEGNSAAALEDYAGMFEGLRVLVVDDVDINIEIAAFPLEKAGFMVESALNGQEALDKYFAAPPGYYSAILMDIQMPVMDGIAAARAIRGHSARPDCQTIPIIALTANAFDEDLRKSIESGMNDHISKPINNVELLALLKRRL